MMLVLVTLGAFTITSARVNYNFSVKALEFNKMYYALEDKAEYFVRAVDGILINAIEGTSPQALTIDGAREALSDLSFRYPESEIIFDGEELLAKIDLVSDDNENAHLVVTLRIIGETGERCAVVEWREWQEVSGEEEEIFLWDGEF